jgi:hypothetical protein
MNQVCTWGPASLSVSFSSRHPVKRRIGIPSLVLILPPSRRCRPNIRAAPMAGGRFFVEISLHLSLLCRRCRCERCLKSQYASHNNNNINGNGGHSRHNDRTEAVFGFPSHALTKHGKKGRNAQVASTICSFLGEGRSLGCEWALVNGRRPARWHPYNRTYICILHRESMSVVSRPCGPKRTFWRLKIFLSFAGLPVAQPGFGVRCDVTYQHRPYIAMFMNRPVVRSNYVHMLNCL